MGVDNITKASTMQEVLKAFPGAQRALFSRYHIGGCSHCGFDPTETLEQVSRRNNILDVQEVMGAAFWRGSQTLRVGVALHFHHV
jgi:hypothetical protein